MADPMTQSHQISSSQGLNDGHSKDSKFSGKIITRNAEALERSLTDLTRTLCNRDWRKYVGSLLRHNVVLVTKPCFDVTSAAMSRLDM